MAGKITQVVWTRQARMSLIAILNYRYSEHPTARNILRKDIIRASKKITFAEIGLTLAGKPLVLLVFPLLSP